MDENNQKGRYIEVENEAVVARLTEIEKEISNYESIKGNVSAISNKLSDASSYLSKVPDEAAKAIQINNASFNGSMRKIDMLSRDVERSINKLTGIIEQIDSEIHKLELEKDEKMNQRTILKWVNW